MMRLITAIATICLLAISATGQQPAAKFDKKHLESHYDKFREQTTVIAKPMNAAFESGKKKYLCSMTVGYAVKGGVKSSLAIMFAPGGSGFMASLARKLDPEIAGVFFSPNSDVILLVNEKRYPLQRIDGVAFAPNGSTVVVAEIPLEAVKAISEAVRWDIAVGPLEAHYSKRATSYYRDKFKAITAAYEQDNGEGWTDKHL
jgi:hypothetical protein